GVQLVIHVDRQSVVGKMAGVCISNRRVLRQVVGGDGGRGRNRRIQRRPVELNFSACLAKTRFSRLEVLVRNVHLLFERVQFRNPEQLPPVGAQCGIGRLRLFPALRFEERLRRLLFECGGGRRGWLRVLRSDSAAGQQRQQEAEDAENGDPHHCSFASTGSTAVPEVSESEGFSMIQSSALSPATTSTSVP